jgi:hypothetical protein
MSSLPHNIAGGSRAVAMEEMIADFFVDSKQKDSRDVRVHNNDAKFLRSSYDFFVSH